MRENIFDVYETKLLLYSLLEVRKNDYLFNFEFPRSERSLFKLKCDNTWLLQMPFSVMWTNHMTVYSLNAFFLSYVSVLFSVW